MWAIIQHLEWEGPGLIADAIEARGGRYAIHRIDQGAAVPARGSFEGLVVMGGTMGVYDSEQYPFLAEEIRLLADCVREGVPVLGICLGAQLLAAALGATVERGPVFESGAGEVELTQAGRQDPVLGSHGGTTLPVVHWHQDTFPLPAGATLLASSDLYTQQAFRAGRRTYGLQFHPEVNAELAAIWRRHGLDLDAEHVRRVEAAGHRLVGQFLAL